MYLLLENTWNSIIYFMVIFCTDVSELEKIKILNEQNTQISTVTGATNTSKVLIKAVEKALAVKTGE